MSSQILTINTVQALFLQWDVSNFLIDINIIL